MLVPDTNTKARYLLLTYLLTRRLESSGERGRAPRPLGSPPLLLRLPPRRLAEPALEAARREDEGVHSGRAAIDLEEA